MRFSLFSYFSKKIAFYKKNFFLIIYQPFGNKNNLKTMAVEPFQKQFLNFF